MPDGPSSFSIQEGSTVIDLFEVLGILGEDVKLIFVNGKRRNSDYVLHEGDRVGLFPPVGGG